MGKLLITFIVFSFIFPKQIAINLIATNDIHGVINEQKANFMNPQYPPTIIGGAAFSNYVDKVRMETVSNNEGLLILDGGNFFQGSPLGIVDNGKTMVEWMNRIGYDAMVPGIYDFISGSDKLNVLSELANFPFYFLIWSVIIVLLLAQILSLILFVKFLESR